MKITIFEEIGGGQPVGPIMEKRVNEFIEGVYMGKGAYKHPIVNVQMSTAFYRGLFHITIMVIETEDRIRTS